MTSIRTHTKQMKLFSSIAAAAVIGTSMIGVNSAQAQYNTYNVRPNYGTGGYTIRNQGTGGSLRVTPSYGGGARFRNSNGGYGTVRPTTGGYRINTWGY